jgi:GNAT superfamily N-acetyltransferase
MPLPILSSPHASPEDLIRFYHRTALHWARQIAEDETALDVGVALYNRTFNDAGEANILLDASLPEGMTAAQAVDLVNAHYAAARVRCRKWVLNPALPGERTAPLAEHLLSIGCTRQDLDIMYLAARPPAPIEEVGGLTIIPARASFKHARELLVEWTARYHPQMPDLTMLNLEDAQTEALIALKDGTPAAFVAVLPVGEIGCIEDVFVSEPFRRQGIGRTMMSRALEICARSLFKHVFLSCEPTNAPAIELYRQIGFERIGAYTQYRAPSP